MDDEVEAPLDDLEALVEDEDDLGDGASGIVGSAKSRGPSTSVSVPTSGPT